MQDYIFIFIVEPNKHLISIRGAKVHVAYLLVFLGTQVNVITFNGLGLSSL